MQNFTGTCNVRTVLSILSFGLMSFTATAETVFLKNSRIGLQPPAGMTVSSTFTGYEDKDNLASVIMVEIPGVFEVMANGFTDQALKERGVTVESRKDLTVNGQDALLLIGEQAIAGQTFQKWIVMLDGDSFVGVITAQVPKTADPKYSDKTILDSLKSIRIKG